MDFTDYSGHTDEANDPKNLWDENTAGDVAFVQNLSKTPIEVLVTTSTIEDPIVIVLPQYGDSVDETIIGTNSIVSIRCQAAGATFTAFRATN